MLNMNMTRCYITSARFEGELNVNKLERWIGELVRDKGEDLFRYRAYLQSKAWTKNSFSGVHMLFGGES